MRLLFLLAFSILCFIVVDSVITLASFGFYTRSFFQFNSSCIAEFLSFENYDFLVSPVDFFFILLLRSLILIVGFVMAIRKLFYRCSLFFFGLQIFNWGYS